MKYHRISKLGGLIAAASVGWFASEWKNNYKSIDPRPGLPLFGTVSAAVKQGNQLVPYNGEIVARPQPKSSRISQIMKFGFPSHSDVRTKHDYVLSYDTRNRIPNWVFEHLTPASIAKNSDVDRDKAHFHEDLSFHPYFRAQNRDYKGSGFDRGHMAAAGNHRQSQENCNETFILSNMAPQVGRGFNRDKWNDLESYCRKLVQKYPNVYICTGPLYLPRQEVDGKLYVKYQVVGLNHVSVPTHFYKVILCEDTKGKLNMEVYLLPNQVIPDSTSLNAFKVPLEVVERASGLLFFNKLNIDKLSKSSGLLTS